MTEIFVYPSCTYLRSFKSEVYCVSWILLCIFHLHEYAMMVHEHDTQRWSCRSHSGDGARVSETGYQTVILHEINRLSLVFNRCGSGWAPAEKLSTYISNCIFGELLLLFFFQLSLKNCTDSSAETIKFNDPALILIVNANCGNDRREHFTLKL